MAFLGWALCSVFGFVLGVGLLYGASLEVNVSGAGSSLLNSLHAGWMSTVNDWFYLSPSNLPPFFHYGSVFGALSLTLAPYFSRRAYEQYRSPLDLGLAAGSLLLLLVASGGFAYFRTSAQEVTIRKSDRQRASAYNTLGFDVLRQLDESANRTNAMLSPVSLGPVLSMLEAGARGKTAQELETALHLPHTDSVAGPRRLMERLRNPEPRYYFHRLVGQAPALTVRLANSGWFNAGLLPPEKGSLIRPEYKKTVQKQFRAQVFEREDFGNGAAKAINDWVDRQTNGKIPSIIERTSPGSAVYLLNALYFYGEWSHPFDPDDTEPAPFRTPSGSSEVDMMSQSREIP
jgi:serpin B